MTLWPPMPGPNFHGFWVEAPSSLTIRVEPSGQPAWSNFLRHVRSEQRILGPIYVGSVKKELEKYNAELIEATDRFSFVNFKDPEQVTMFLLRWSTN